METLCNSEAKAGSSDKGGFSTLTTPCRYDKIEIVKLLLQSGADPSGGNGLHLALEMYHQDIVKTLIDNGSDVNKVNLF